MMLMPQHHKAPEHSSTKIAQGSAALNLVSFAVACSCGSLVLVEFFLFGRFWKEETESTVTGTSLLDTGLEVLGIKGAR